MYHAKRAGRGTYAVYRAEADHAHRRLELTARLRAAIGRGELELHYQPVFDLGRGTVAGVEALVRWNDPERGRISPAEFIPLAEDTGLIDALGEWVLDATCRQARVWHDQGLRLDVAFNVSPLELMRPGFARRVGDAVAAHGADPNRLVIEIIESALADADAVGTVLEQVAALGVRIAIDDFGAGFSSLTRLRHLTVHMLKLDRAFLADVPGDPRGSAFITAMLELARRLGLHVVAEGIEEPEQLEVLRGEGCELGQGYHLARPLPVAEVTALLAADQSCTGRGGAPS
jgi:EAL domain-containing protein (putative c-di-GMP-specific phosphodiesterase class I)